MIKASRTEIQFIKHFQLNFDESRIGKMTPFFIPGYGLSTLTNAHELCSVYEKHTTPETHTLSYKYYVRMSKHIHLRSKFVRNKLKTRGWVIPRIYYAHTQVLSYKHPESRLLNRLVCEFRTNPDWDYISVTSDECYTYFWYYTYNYILEYCKLPHISFPVLIITKECCNEFEYIFQENMKKMENQPAYVVLANRLYARLSGSG